MIIPIPGGGLYNTDDSPGVLYLNGGAITLHTPLALSRLIERWKGKANLTALLSTFTDQVQILENAIHDVNTQRLLDNAGTAQLIVIGRIVGEPQAGMGNAQYRARIKVRIRINQSFGTADDVIEVLQMLDPAVFTLTEYTAAFDIVYSGIPETSAALSLASIIKQTRAAGVGSTVTVPTDLARGARYGTVHSVPTNKHVGFGSVYDTSVGGLLAHIAQA